ncbi:MAG: hypothetical protein Q8N05_01760 [Bacteroidota bacterium]|nr:hypothetical protein [Bacteroidota bacterium]
MKTTNIAQKTGSSLFKTFAVVVSLVFIGMSTNVNGFWSPLLVDNAMDKTKLVAINQETDALQTIAFLKPASHSMEATGTTNAFYIEPARDKSLEIESWMTDESIWEN